MDAAVKKRVIFLDGASVNHMKFALGIKHYNFRGLYQVLVRMVGKGNALPLAFPPLITMHPDRIHLNGPHTLAKDLAGGGFEVIPASSLGSADDEAIIDRIYELDPQKIGEIVIVTRDKDFIPSLLHKANEGIRVHWVATTALDPTDHRPSLAVELRDLFEQKVFGFFDLKPLNGMICAERLGTHEARAHVHADAAAHRDDSFSKIIITLRSKDRKQHLKLANELRRLEEEIKGLHLEILE